MEEKIYFNNKEGMKLCGILSKPEKDTNKCIVLCHGLTVDKDELGRFNELAEKLADAGFNVFRFDFRGHGESEGNSADMTITGEERDLESVFEFLQNLGYEEFGIVGASFAGGAVSLFTPKHQDTVKALILWNALIDYSSKTNPSTYHSEKYWGEPAFEKAEKFGFVEINEEGFRVGKRFMNELKILKPYEELKKLRIPVLFVHSDKDDHVPYEDSVKYSNLIENTKLVTIHGTGHGFHDNKKHAEEACKAAVNFFLDNLTKS